MASGAALARRCAAPTGGLTPRRSHFVRHLQTQEVSIMADTSSLASRLDAEFAAVEERVKKVQVEKSQEQKGRQQRLEQLGKVFDQLAEIWKPPLDLLVQRFGDRVQTTPRIVPSTREVAFNFQSRQARVRLKFSASTDRDIQKVVLSYDLEIIPILQRFKPHDELEFPLGAVNKEAVGKWIDDRIVDFVKTYFSMGENEIYLKDQMVEDPITHVHFPKVAAAAKVEWQGQTFYFISEESRSDFEKQKGLGSK
jgi:YHS domain-containing protein